MRRPTLLAALALACAGLASSPPARSEPPAAARSEMEVLDIRNKGYKFRSISLDDAGSLVITSPDGALSKVPCAEVAEITFKAGAGGRKPPQLEVTLSNRDVIVGDLAGGSSSSITVKSPDLAQPIELKLENLQKIVFPAVKPLATTPEPKADEDVVWRATGDTDVGVVAAIEPGGVKFNSSLFKRTETFALSDLALVHFSQLSAPPAEPPDLLAIVDCARGSRLTGKLKALKWPNVELETLYGDTLTLPVGNLSSIFFKNGACVYVSDLQPSKVVEYWFTGTGLEGTNSDDALFPNFHFQRDRGLFDPPRRLSIKQVEYRKGLAVHSHSDLTYALEGRYKRFLATVAFEDQAAPSEESPDPLRFLVFVDGKQVFDSGILHWESKAVEVDVPVAGAKEIRLVCTFGNNDLVDGLLLGRGVWAGARLIR